MKTLVLAAALALPLAGCNGTESASTPRILMEGDSISVGYTQYLSIPGAEIEHAGYCDAAPYHQPDDTDDNSEGSAHQAACIKKWLANGPYAIVHFNAGIWDLRCGAGTPQDTDLSDYLENLQTVLDAIRESGAIPIFATTTPAPEHNGFCVDNAKVIEYNAAAVQMMRSQGVAVDDLYSAVRPLETQYQIPESVHFKDSGYQFLGETVSNFMQQIVN
ncbi:MAG TPA: SGNH/GDSL hydrolase family protein [Gammaproteobacteria bacterium]